jgi:hypothetical protein
MRMLGRHTFGIAVVFFATSALCGCVDLNSTELNETGKAAAAASEAMVKEKGAAVVVRVKINNAYCDSGIVTLNKYIDGRISEESTSIGQVTHVTGSEKLGDISSNLLKLNFSALPISKSNDLRVSYEPIEPGAYVVTKVECLNPGTSNYTLGPKPPSLFEAPVKVGPRPVAGEGYIQINRGQIVDAGLLDINALQIGGFQVGGQGRLVASEAPTSFRETIRKNLPQLYSRITYTKFSSYPVSLLVNLLSALPSTKETHAKAQ